MTVKCVSNDLKPLIAHAYAVEGVDSETLALAHDVSKRTIQRILVEGRMNLAAHRPAALCIMDTTP